MGPSTKQQIFPVSRSQTLEEKQRRTEVERKKNLCRSWMFYMTTKKEETVSSLACCVCWRSYDHHFKDFLFMWLSVVVFPNIIWILHVQSLLDERKHKVEPMWSIDPALALSMYDSERREDEVQTSGCTDLKTPVLTFSLPALFFRKKSVVQKCQIQTAPGSVTAYCSVSWKTVLTERKAFVVRKRGGPY